MVQVFLDIISFEIDKLFRIQLPLTDAIICINFLDLIFVKKQNELTIMNN